MSEITAALRKFDAHSITVCIILTFLIYIFYNSLSVDFPFLITGDGFVYFDALLTNQSTSLVATTFPYFVMNLFGDRPSSHLINFVVAFQVFIASVIVGISIYFALKSKIRSLPFFIIGGVALNFFFIFYMMSFRPEWITGFLGLAAGMVCLSWPARAKILTKSFLFVVLSVIITLAIIIKINAIVYIGFIPIVLLFEYFSSRNARNMLIFIFIFIITSVLVAAPYYSWHSNQINKPFSLKSSYVSGWNLIYSQSLYRGEISASHGDASARLMLLANTLPPAPMPGSQSWTNIGNEGDAALERTPPELRALVAEIKVADPEQLQALFTRHDLPDTTDLPQFPARYVFNALYYLGLPEGDALLTRTYLEGLAADPAGFLSQVRDISLGFLLLRSYDGLPRQVLQAGAEVHECPIRPTGEDPSAARIRSCAHIEGAPISLARFFYIDRWMLITLFAIGFVLLCVTSLAHVRQRNNIEDIRMIAVCWTFIIIIVGEAVFSGIVIGFARYKELISTLPLYICVFPISLHVFARCSYGVRLNEKFRLHFSNIKTTIRTSMNR